VNAGSVLLQAFIASRVASRFGLRGVLLALPIVALGAYGALATGVSFLVFRAMKVAENATDYSLQNTGKALIWLGASRDEKYKAKQVIDAYFMRFGDVLSALLVFAATHLIELSPRALALVNVVFTLLALAVSLRVSREAAGQAQSATNG
jgi:AAA family ATP:ADP antiporter